MRKLNLIIPVLILAVALLLLFCERQPAKQNRMSEASTSITEDIGSAAVMFRCI